jgi:esterase/lipase superfamily enzyme
MLKTKFYMNLKDRKKLSVPSLTSFALLSIVSVLYSTSAFADITGPICSNYHSTLLNKKVNYCVDRTTPNAPFAADEPVTYFMHGTHGSAKTWTKNNYAHSLEQMRESSSSLPPMTFVSFDTSAYSFFTDHPNKPHEAYETWFISEFIPFIEANYSVCNHQECRNIMGESMGGFGALKTILRHRDLFNAVAVNSPALPAFSVYAPMSNWIEYFSHQTIGALEGFMLIKIVRSIMPSEASWEAQNPIALSQAMPAEHYPPIYFDMGGKDNYGFFDGYAILKGVFDQKGISYQTNFDPDATHDMWKFHASDAIQFILDHTVQATPAMLSSKN